MTKQTHKTRSLVSKLGTYPIQTALSGMITNSKGGAASRASEGQLWASETDQRFVLFLKAVMRPKAAQSNGSLSI
jgi:hypothetical protein